MKKVIAKFLLFVYLQHVKEDWNEYTPLGKFIIYPAWFIKSIFIWIISPIFIVQYLFLESDTYKTMMKMQESMSPKQIKTYNKMATRNFLNKLRK